MATERRCSHCGQVIPWGQAECPFCAEHGTFLWFLGRDTFLLLTFVALGILFVVTGFAAKFYHAKQKTLATEWYGRGETKLKAGRPDLALEDFRNALAYSRDNALYRLRLAQALVAAGRFPEARVYLLNLWDEEPGSGIVNLELAHLAVHEGSVQDALRFFHNAIYGEWSNDPAQHRQAARLELAEFLLAAGDRIRAQSELIALVPDLPQDPALQTRVGTLFMRVGEYEQALKLFRQALSVNPHFATALAGAGRANFELAKYSQAQYYLERALRADPHVVGASTLLETSRAVLGIDPFERRLSSEERGRRAQRAFEQAMERLQACATHRGLDLDAPSGNTDLQTIYGQARQLKPGLRARKLARDPQLLVNTMDLVFDMERIAKRECGEAHGLDLALLLVAQMQGASRP